MARPVAVNHVVSADWVNNLDLTPGAADYVVGSGMAETTPISLTWRSNAMTPIREEGGLPWSQTMQVSGAAAGGSGSGNMAGYLEFGTAMSFSGVDSLGTSGASSGDLNGTAGPISISVSADPDDLIGWVYSGTGNAAPTPLTGTSNTVVEEQADGGSGRLAVGTSTGNINLTVSGEPYEWHVVWYILKGAGSPPEPELSVDDQPTTGISGVPLDAIVIESTDSGFTGSVTATIQSGSGVLSGTTAVNAVAGVATFSNLIITGTGAHTLRFSASGYDPVDSASITISAAPSGGRFRPYFVRH